MNRKIFYVDCYCEGEKERNIGFIKVEEESIIIVLRGLPLNGKTVCKVYVEREENDRRYLTDISLENGYGQISIKWSKEWKREELGAIYIPIDRKRYGRCVVEQEMVKKIEQSNIQPFPKDKSSMQKNIKEKTVQQEKVIIMQEKLKPKSVIEPLAESMPIMEEDKWKQLCRNYSQVHIYPEADTIVIKPRDMVILTKEYHELATNSFVLHAYYNYRQLLLLRYRKEMETVYYLGVPGVYYEREKRIAYMFGFEGFENGESRLVNEDRRQAYAGCFGYYMKQVNI